jgi:predicted HTH transcriptional regulator
MNLIGLLKQPEGKTLECKRDLSSPEGVLRSIVAFANTAGGVLLVGIESRTRRVLGVADPLETEERLANLVSDSISPILVPELQVFPWRKTHVLGAKVHPSGTRPHYLKSLGPDAGVFVRVGSTNRRADTTLIEELRRLVRNESYDEQPMPDLNSEALDFRTASESFAPIRALKRADLATLRMTTQHQGRTVPTVGGMLLFGKERARYFPDAWVQAGRFQGADRRRILDTSDIHTYLAPAAEQAVQFVQRHASREAIISGVRRTDRWAFPLAAVREAMINAVVHADYSQRGTPIRISVFDDRLEVENPGLLPYGLTVEDIRKGVSKLRNRVIGRVFREIGLIEQWGSGIQRMIGACVEAGLDPPILEEVGTHFRVTLLAVRRRAPLLDEQEKRIIRTLGREDGLATREISRAISRSERATRARLAALVERGLVVEVGSGPTDPQRRYFLALAAAEEP